MRPDRGEPVVFGDASIDLKLIEEGEASRRAAGHGDRDRVVQRHHRII